LPRALQHPGVRKDPKRSRRRQACYSAVPTRSREEVLLYIPGIRKTRIRAEKPRRGIQGTSHDIFSPHCSSSAAKPLNACLGGHASAEVRDTSVSVLSVLATGSRHRDEIRRLGECASSDLLKSTECHPSSTACLQVAFGLSAVRPAVSWKDGVSQGPEPPEGVRTHHTRSLKPVRATVAALNRPSAVVQATSRTWPALEGHKT
jgi:hypothetical protein